VRFLRIYLFRLRLFEDAGFAGSGYLLDGKSNVDQSWRRMIWSDLKRVGAIRSVCLSVHPFFARDGNGMRSVDNREYLTRQCQDGGPRNLFEHRETYSG